MAQGLLARRSLEKTLLPIVEVVVLRLSLSLLKSTVETESEEEGVAWVSRWSAIVM